MCLIMVLHNELNMQVTQRELAISNAAYFKGV